MASVIDDQVAAQLNTSAAMLAKDLGTAFARGILRQTDGADELARQAFIGLVADNRLITALNAREIVMAADPGTIADQAASRAFKEAPAGWPQPAAPGAPGGAAGAASGKVA